MKRVYIAGSYNAPNIIEALDNMRRGMNMATKVLVSGFAPFCPWLDFHFRLMNENITREMYHAYSMAWVEVSNAMLVMPNSEDSQGTQKEIARAKELDIPIYYELIDLIANEQ